MSSLEKQPNPGEVIWVAPQVRRVLAANPSPMTYWGTNTYLVGTGRVAVIDPGPALSTHYDAILAALSPHEVIGHILVTHAHRDHSPLARPLAQATGAPVLAFGDALAGRSPLMQALVASGMASGGEGVDNAFAPDICLVDGDQIDTPDWSLQALWTPGHFANHMSFAFDGIVFTGDHVMGWASSLVSPPDGDLTAFLASCQKLAARTDRLYLPGHGAPVDDPSERIAWLIAHRRQRETQIRSALSDRPVTIASLTRRIYTETPAALLPAAERNVFAHLIDLHERKRVRACPTLSFTAEFAAC